MSIVHYFASWEQHISWSTSASLPPYIMYSVVIDMFHFPAPSLFIIQSSADSFSIDAMGAGCWFTNLDCPLASKAGADRLIVHRFHMDLC